MSAIKHDKKKNQKKYTSRPHFQWETKKTKSVRHKYKKKRTRTCVSSCYLRVLVGPHPGGAGQLALLASGDVHRTGRDVVLQDRQRVVLHLTVHFHLHGRRVPTQLAAFTW